MLKECYRKIIASAFFLLLGVFLAFSVFQQYQKILIPGLILLTIGFILLSIWVDGLYIYRYLLPAILIILVFTVYPIGYTVFIAFTNYGTGHLMLKEDARNEILSGKWVIDEDERPLYAEFYVNSSAKQISKFNKDWSIEKDKTIRKVKEAKEAYLSKNKDIDPNDIYEDDIRAVADIKDNWYDEVQPKIIDSLSSIKLEDFIVICPIPIKVFVEDYAEEGEMN